MGEKEKKTGMIWRRIRRKKCRKPGAGGLDNTNRIFRLKLGASVGLGRGFDLNQLDQCAAAVPDKQNVVLPHGDLVGNLHPIGA